MGHSCKWRIDVYSVITYIHIGTVYLFWLGVIQYIDLGNNMIKLIGWFLILIIVQFLIFDLVEIIKKTNLDSRFHIISFKQTTSNTLHHLLVDGDDVFIIFYILPQILWSDLSFQPTVVFMTNILTLLHNKILQVIHKFICLLYHTELSNV